MKTIIFNDSNLQPEEIERVATKVRGIVINKDGKALVAK